MRFHRADACKTAVFSVCRRIKRNPMYPSFWCEITHVTQRKPYFVKTFTYYIECDTDPPYPDFRGRLALAISAVDPTEITVQRHVNCTPSRIDFYIPAHFLPDATRNKGTQQSRGVIQLAVHHEKPHWAVVGINGLVPAGLGLKQNAADVSSWLFSDIRASS